MAPSLGKWMTHAGQEFLPDADIIAPVPLHPYRLWKRRYNQSALLTKEVAGYFPDVVMKLQLLKRKRHTPPQTGLTQKQRQDNVKGAFMVNARYKEYIRNKHIVLVDDVMTTGATVNACASALLKDGARRVDILTLCQTLK
jgi:ComF family protein